MANPLDLALAIAAAGTAVFPCGSNKRPCIPKTKGGRGFHDATTDPAEIRRLFGFDGAVLVGIPTGERSGIDVLDVDYRNGGGAWEDANAERLPETRTHQTQHGGRHYVFLHAPGVRNSAAKFSLAPGIDVRGDGGYIIMPPSTGYSVSSDAPVTHWPDWLLELVLARPVKDESPESIATPTVISSKRLEGFVRSLADRIASAADGSKHYTLRNMALSFGGIAGQVGIGEKEAVERLVRALPAAAQDANAYKTAHWGIVTGQARPIQLTDRPQYQSRKAINGSGNGHARPEPVAETLEALDEVKDSRPPSDTPHIPYVTYSEINEVAEPQDFIEDLLTMGTMSVIYGQSNCGKSFFALDLAIRVAAGIPWREQAVDRGAVLYLALEGGQQGIRNRLMAVKQEYGWDAYDLPFAFIATPIDLRHSDAHLDPLIATVRHLAARFAGLGCPVRWIIVDTLARAMAGGNENASEDMGALIINCDRLRAVTECHLSLIHHSGKDEAKGARGHSSLEAADDTGIEVVDNDGTRTVTITKQRDLETLPPFTFTLRRVEIGTNRRGKPITTCLVDYGDAPPAKRPARRAGGTHADRALEVLVDVCAGSGARGYAGVPDDVVSVPEQWWRDRFYDRAMPGETTDTKKHAFRRAASALINQHTVGMANSRVWVVAKGD